VKIPFVKMHGLGNDFVLLDQRERQFNLGPAQIAQLADRRFGIGCDQLLSLENPDSADAAVRYRVYNADGSSAEHCGNGVRCVARYLERRGEAAAGKVLVEIGREVFELALLADGQVRVDMGAPRFAPADIPLAVDAEAERYGLTFDGQAWNSARCRWAIPTRCSKWRPPMTRRSPRSARCCRTTPCSRVA
jgi:diaminopimelate epimerase